MDHIPISKSENQELSVPSAWRPALKALADACVLQTDVPQIEDFVINSIDVDQLQICRSNIEEYPDTLGPLSEESWKSSIYVWNEGYWAVLVDLTTNSGEVSDLVLHARVTERGDQYLIEPGLIYVP